MYARAIPIGTAAISHGLLQDSITNWRYPGFGVGRQSVAVAANEEAIANGIVQVNAPLNEGTKKAPPGGEAEIPAGCPSVPAVDTEDEANEVSAFPMRLCERSESLFVKQKSEASFRQGS